MPRLAIIAHVVVAGGPERFLQELVRALLQLPEIKRWKITLFLTRKNSAGLGIHWPARLRRRGLALRFLHDDWTSRLRRAFSGTPDRPPPAVASQQWLERRVDSQSFDVAYFIWPYQMECPGLAVPMVATVHDFNFKRSLTLTAEQCAGFEKRTPLWLQRCSKLVVSTPVIAGEFRSYYPDFEDKLKVIYPGVPRLSATPSESDAVAFRKKAGLSRPFLLCVGWIFGHKNQKVVFEALSLLRAQGVDLQLVCVGPNSRELEPSKGQQANPYLREVLETCGRLGLEYGRDFRGLGFVEDRDLGCLYRLAEATVVPTLYEAGSFPLVEAIRSGCPVVSSRIPALVEEVRAVGGHAWFFEPHDPRNLADVVTEILRDPTGARQKARQASHDIEERFSWQKTARAYLSVFEEALNGRSHL